MLNHLADDASVKEISLCHCYLAIVNGFQGNYERAKAEAEAGYQLTKSINHVPGLAFAQNLRGTLAQQMGDYVAAHDYFQESLALRQQMGDVHGTAVALNNLGNLANAQQDYEAARRYYEESQLLFKEINHRPGRAATLGNAGVAAMRLGELAEARRLHDESLLLKQELGNRRSIGISLINLGEVLCQLGESDASRRAFHEALRLLMEIQAHPLALDALVGLAILLQEERLELALRLLQLAARHPASGRETQQRAGQQLEALETAVAGGKLENLEEVVAEVLRPYA